MAAVAASADTKAIASIDVTGFSWCARHRRAAIRPGFGHRREKPGVRMGPCDAVCLLIRLKLTFSGADVAGSGASGEVTWERCKGAFQSGAGHHGHCVSAGDRVKWNEVVPAPISAGRISPVCTSLARTQRKDWAC